MARGSKSKYSSKQKRQAHHIEKGYEDRGVSKKEAERRAWAMENKTSGGGRKKGGSGRGKKGASPPRARAGGKAEVPRMAGKTRRRGPAPPRRSKPARAVARDVEQAYEESDHAAPEARVRAEDAGVHAEAAVESAEPERSRRLNRAEPPEARRARWKKAAGILAAGARRRRH